MNEADNVSLIQGESARLKRHAQAKGFLPCRPLGPPQGARNNLRPGSFACEFFQGTDIFCRPRSSFHWLASSRSLQSRTATKTPRQFADIDLNHTFLFFRPLNRLVPLAEFAPTARHFAMERSRMMMAKRGFGDARSGRQPRHGLLLVQSFIRTSAFLGADADAFDNAGDAEKAGRGRGNGSGADEAVRRCWRMPA
jgi:hypothetical protein